MPWFPFFMNCDYFGDHVYIYRLLETMKNCTIVPEDDTVVVEPIPISGITPKADECDLNFRCYYSEDVTYKRSNFNY